MGKKRWRRGSVEWTAGESGDQQLRVFFLGPEQLRGFFLWPEQMRVFFLGTEQLRVFFLGPEQLREFFYSLAWAADRVFSWAWAAERVAAGEGNFGRDIVTTWACFRKSVVPESVALKSVSASGGNCYTDRVLYEKCCCRRRKHRHSYHFKCALRVLQEKEMLRLFQQEKQTVTQTRSEAVYTTWDGYSTLMHRSGQGWWEWGKDKTRPYEFFFAVPLFDNYWIFTGQSRKTADLSFCWFW